MDYVGDGFGLGDGLGLGEGHYGLDGLDGGGYLDGGLGYEGGYGLDGGLGLGGEALGYELGRESLGEELLEDGLAFGAGALAGGALGYGLGRHAGYGGGYGAGYGGGYYDDGGLGLRSTSLVGPGYGGVGYVDDLALGVGGGYGRSLGGGLGFGGGYRYEPVDVDLYNEMSFLDRELPLVDAWGGPDEWRDEQWALADMLHWQRQLEMDRALSEAERIRLFEQRLRFEELEERERELAYRRMNARQRALLGLENGWWARRLAGRRDLDLGHLHRVPLTRGLFSGPYRQLFHRHGRLFGRFRPFLERDRLRPWRDGGGFARGVGLRGPNLRDMELAMRIRIAEGTGKSLLFLACPRSTLPPAAAPWRRQPPCAAASAKSTASTGIGASAARADMLAAASEEAARDTERVVEESNIRRTEEVIESRRLAERGLIDPRVAGLTGAARLGGGWY